MDFSLLPCWSAKKRKDVTQRPFSRRDFLPYCFSRAQKSPFVEALPPRRWSRIGTVCLGCVVHTNMIESASSQLQIFLHLMSFALSFAVRCFWDNPQKDGDFVTSAAHSIDILYLFNFQPSFYFCSLLLLGLLTLQETITKRISRKKLVEMSIWSLINWTQFLSSICFKEKKLTYFCSLHKKILVHQPNHQIPYEELFKNVKDTFFDPHKSRVDRHTIVKRLDRAFVTWTHRDTIPHVWALWVLGLSRS